MASRVALADAAAGVVGSLVAMLTFYPIDVIKTNLQAGKGNEHKSNRGNDESEFSRQRTFIKSLFRGLHLKAAHTATSSFAYFYIFSWIQTKHRKLHSRNNNDGMKYRPSTTARLLLAAIAGCCNVTLTLPLDVLAARSQTNVSNNEKHDDATKTIDDEEEKSSDCIDSDDARSDSNGKEANIIMDEVWKNVGEQYSDDDYDTAHEEMNDENCKQEEKDAGEDLLHFHQTSPTYGSHFPDKHHNGHKDLYSNIVDEDRHSVADELSSQAMNRNDKHQNGNSYVRPIFRIDSMNQPFPKQLVFALSLLKHESNKNKLHKVMELWRGIGPSLLLCSNPSINFTVFDTLKDQVLRHKKLHHLEVRLNMAEAFLLGIIAKFAATIATYPLIRAKIMMMVAKNNEGRNCCDADDNKHSMIGVLRDMFEKDGIAELYKGCRLQLLHTLLKSALMMMVREKITANIRQLILSK